LSIVALRTHRAALLVCLAGLVAFGVAWYVGGHLEGTRPDFATFWRASQVMLAGDDPYQVIPREFGSPLYYPLTAPLLLAPFTLLPLRMAQATFAGLSAAVLAWAGLRYGRGLGPALLSMSALQCVAQGQWSILLTAGVVLPWLSTLWAAKPSNGAALFAAAPHRAAVLGGVVLLAATLLIDPHWPKAWLGTVADVNHLPLLVRPGGAILLLGLLRWRLPEARLLVALACVPQAGVLYEAVPLFLIPRSRLEGYGLALGTYVADFVQVWLSPAASQPTLEASIAARWPVLLALVYLPALVLVLRRPATVSAPA
jgi:hypothetical protein